MSRENSEKFNKTVSLKLMINEMGRKNSKFYGRHVSKKNASQAIMRLKKAFWTIFVQVFLTPTCRKKS